MQMFDQGRKRTSDPYCNHEKGRGGFGTVSELYESYNDAGWQRIFGHRWKPKRQGRQSTLLKLWFSVIAQSRRPGMKSIA
eukprot:755069-Hanusia_phi.AAC.2